VETPISSGSPSGYQPSRGLLIWDSHLGRRVAVRGASTSFGLRALNRMTCGVKFGYPGDR
jgi:hypothetical protein